MFKNQNKTLIVAGGGTGGHIWAGVVIAEEWKKKHGLSTRVLFVGARGGLEERLVPKAGLPLNLIQIGPLKRVTLIQRLKTLFQAPLSLFQCLKWTLDEKPYAVIGVGGYASGPMVLVGSLLTRSGILEQNSVPGLTNRLLGRVASKVFCAFQETATHFSSSKTLVTGNPIRTSMKEMAPAVSPPFTIFIFGGSRGALGVNTLVIGALESLSKNHPALFEDLRWIHQTGPVDFDRVKSAHEKFKTQHEVSPFIDDMPAMYRVASLIICRAGASSLSELSAVGRASIMVPLPTAADNHQELNAKILEAVGATVVVNQTLHSGSDVAKLIVDFYQNPARLRLMEAQIKAFYQPLAAATIVEALSA